MTAPALSFHPVVELTGHFVESSVGGGTRGLEVATVSGIVVDDERAARKVHVDGDSVAVPVKMMVTRQVHNDVARDHAVEKLVELFGPPSKVRGERVRIRDVSKCDLKWNLHGDASTSCHSTFHACREPVPGGRLVDPLRPAPGASGPGIPHRNREPAPNLRPQGRWQISSRPAR